MFLEHPVTPKHARMRGDKSPILPPLTPLPSRRQDVSSNPATHASGTCADVASGVNGLRTRLSRSNSGATKASSVFAASATGSKARGGLESNGFNGGEQDSSNYSSSAGSCESGQHRERLAQLTASTQHVDQQQLRLTSVSMGLAVGLFYLLLERLGFKHVSLMFTFGAYVPLLHVLPAFCAFSIVWLRLPRRSPQSTPAPAARAAAGSVPASHPGGLEEEVLQKYVSRSGLLVVRQSEHVHVQFATCILRSLVCLAIADFFSAYVQFWPLFHSSSGAASPLSTAAISAADRPAIFGPPPPGVVRKGFERYPPEDVHLPQRSPDLNGSNSSALFVYGQRAAAVLTYLLRVLAAVWVLKAANAVAPRMKAASARDDTQKQSHRRGTLGEHQKNWTAYVKSLPGGTYFIKYLCALGISEGAVDTFMSYCCSLHVVKQLLFSLLSAFLLSKVWRIPLSTPRPTGFLSAFSRLSSQDAATSGCMLAIGLLGLAALQLLANALLPFIKEAFGPLLRRLQLRFFSLSSRFSPPSSSSVAASASSRQRQPVQQACLSLLVAALLLEIFSTIVGVHAVLHVFMVSGAQVNLLGIAEVASKSERIVICSAAVAHTLAAFVFASAGTCCSLRNYLISKIMRDGYVDEQRVLGGLYASS